jgi:hypothetical protein
MKRVLSSFFLIINYKTLIVTTLSLVSTFLCIQYNFTAKFPDMLVGVAIVFPVVFSIGSAYTRRETALQRLSDFKGHAIAIYFAFRDWPTEGEKGLTNRYRILITEMFVLLREMLMVSHHEHWSKNEKTMYDKFSELSSMTIQLRAGGVQSGEISRVSQYVSKMIIAFDNIKVIHNYRTPITLRAYSKVFIYVFPIVYGPYFASEHMEYSMHLEYAMPVLYSFILVSLDNIQDHLENPFDEVGEDDIRIDGNDTLRQLS